MLGNNAHFMNMGSPDPSQKGTRLCDDEYRFLRTEHVSLLHDSCDYRFDTKLIVASTILL